MAEAGCIPAQLAAQAGLTKAEALPSLKPARRLLVMECLPLPFSDAAESHSSPTACMEHTLMGPRAPQRARDRRLDGNCPSLEEPGCPEDAAALPPV